jgi:hypothetical protein
MNSFAVHKRLFWLATALLTMPLPVLAADIVGRITLVTSTTDRLASTSIVIQGPKMASTPIDKAMVRVTSETKVFRRALVGGNVTSVPAKPADLQMGQMVEATFAGPVAMTYPAQGTASEVVILDQGLADAGNVTATTAFPVIKEGEVVTLTGKLQRGVMALGGETTGWTMPYVSAQGLKTIEVDFTTASGEKPVDGKAFKVTGKVILKRYIERGPTLILSAAKVENPPFSAAPATPQPDGSASGNTSTTVHEAGAVPTGTTNSPYEAK